MFKMFNLNFAVCNYMLSQSQGYHYTCYFDKGLFRSFNHEENMYQYGCKMKCTFWKMCTFEVVEYF